MNDNKELNDNLQRLFSTIKDAYGIAGMIKDIKEKEVVDKQNYEVLRMIDELGYIHFPGADGMPCLENCNIYSVKNLNNNEPFSIGDKTDEGTIKSFYIEDNILWVRTEEKGGVVSINDIQKVAPKDYEIIERFDYYEGAYDGDIAPIKSVRRLSDNEVFSIGDILHDGCIETAVTSISGGNYPILKGDKGSIGLDVARKKRVPLFTTEDSFSIEYLDWIVYVVNTAWVVFDKKAEWCIEKINDSQESKYFKYFSTEDKAKTFIYHNKPCLSYNDAVHWLASDGSGYGLYEIVKEKINNQ